MANALTGEFDVVALFSATSADRVLAGMHRIERFPHSLSLRLDDIPRDRLWPSAVAAVNNFGELTVSHDDIGTPDPADPALASLGALVNVDFGDLVVAQPDPTHIKGRAQLQLFPPKLRVERSPSARVQIEIELIARYFPDGGVSPLAEFCRGTLRISAAVDQVASQTANIIDIAIRATTLGIEFTNAWSSRPLSAQDLEGICRLIRNVIRSSFLPANSRLPPHIAHMQFRALPSALFGAGQIATLLNMSGNKGNPASFSSSFLHGGDDFAFAVGADFVRAALQPTLDKIMSDPIAPVSFGIDYLFSTYTVTYTITLSSAALNLENGRMVMIIKGHAHTPSSLAPDFDFTVTQPCTLAVSGSTAELVLGDISLDTSSWIVDLFKGAALPRFRSTRDRALQRSDALAKVRAMFDADRSIGEFLKSLLTPPARTRPQVVPKGYSLAYTAAEIRPTGIVLHGHLSVTAWPAPVVQFEKIPPHDPMLTPSALQGPDYSALASWIPGGVIDRFEWKQASRTLAVEANRFIYNAPGLASGSTTASAAPAATGSAVPDLSAAEFLGHVSGYAPLCLTVHGTRLAASGPSVTQQVSGTACGFGAFDLLTATQNAAPAVLLAQPDARGNVQISGVTGARTGAAAPNLIVHFGDAHSITGIDQLVSALQGARRVDAATAIVAVAARDAIEASRHVAGIVYAEDAGAWRRALGVMSSSEPLTIIASPKGVVLWQQEGPIDERALAVALAKTLLARRAPRLRLTSPSIRSGTKPPDFMFTHAPGQQITLSKLLGRRVLLWFGDVGTDLLPPAPGAEGEPAVVLAIGGESAAATKAVSVPDPGGRIAAAYGITVRPSQVLIDELGNIEDIQQGRGSEHRRDDMHQTGEPQ